EAAEVLQKGGLVAFPTETVYGLGANALDETAAARIYAAKGRPSDNPLIVHIADVASLKELAREVPEEAYALADAFWPGPLTIILNKKPCVPDGTTGGLKTVAIRFPNDDIALSLIRESGLCIAAPSANASGRPSPTTAQHVYDDLNGRIEYILDGGPVNIGVESTIIDLSGKKPLILRPGYITQADLAKVIGPVEYDKAVISKVPQAGVVAKAPGMKYRHYAPKGELTIVEGKRENVIAYINRRVEELNKEGRKTGVIATDETAGLYKNTTVLSLGKRADEMKLTHGLFAILREFDDIGAEYMFTESFYDTKLSEAIMNRLRKAAGYKTVNADEEQ
ncbi:MAG: threonylcarbamoyl-AMP synthase, partial [Lachnospiraceae bacterium]|nr:threonylcarbamoyl-AMP synthase [Lachnospiraceae bacterium]